MTNAEMKLFAWARPLDKVPFLDHTWVTDYEPASEYSSIQTVIAADKYCWFSWGSFHVDNYRSIGSAKGGFTQSSCIAAPNVQSGQTAHGTIFFYGFNGVCHQLSNQILYSSINNNSAPLTVHKANGYRISSFLYKTYGRPGYRWRALANKCVKVSTLQSGLDDFIDHLLSFGEGFIQQEEFENLLALRSIFSGGLDTIATDTVIMGSPENITEKINDLIHQTMSRAADILGKERYLTVFSTEAHTPTPLVDLGYLRNAFEARDGDFRP